MKHLFLPLPIDYVKAAWEARRESDGDRETDVRLVEVRGGCCLVTESGRPPRVFVDLLKGSLERQTFSLRTG